jgi:tetratricopeptide (TPR) repeat protein
MSTYPILCFLLLAQSGGSGDFAQYASQAEAARTADRLSDAIPLYRKALALKPSWTEGWFALGTIEYDRNNYQDAALAFQRAVALNAKAGTARIMLGLCEFELGQADVALNDIEMGERIGAADDPSLQHVALYHQGLLLQRKGQFEDAQKALDAVCRDGIESAEVEAAQGLVALRLRDAIPPQEAQGAVMRVGRAQCLAARKEFAEAGKAYAEALKENPQFLNIHYAYGRFLLDRLDTAAALSEFRREIELHPNHTLARLQIAAIDYKVDSAAGLPYAEAAVKLDPSLPLGHYLLGALLLDRNDFQRAIPELESAKQKLQNDPRVAYSLGLAYARAGRDQDAKREREEFQRLSKQAESK